MIIKIIIGIKKVMLQEVLCIILKNIFITLFCILLAPNHKVIKYFALNLHKYLNKWKLHIIWLQALILIYKKIKRHSILFCFLNFIQILALNIQFYKNVAEFFLARFQMSELSLFWCLNIKKLQFYSCLSNIIRCQSSSKL